MDKSEKKPISDRALKQITIRGARQHNLKNVDVIIPRNALVVITGPSGSGKSSLAFDTLYAEGQRRYVESLSAYARQFLDRLQKPDVEHIEGLSPAIAIEQRGAGGSPRSIVATTTEIYDYLRLLYAHVGLPHCPKCGKRVAGQSAQQICDHLLSLPKDRKMILLAPYVRGRKGEHREIFETMARDGFVRVRVDGEIRMLEDDQVLEKTHTHTIEAVVDRLITGRVDRTRLNDSVELALSRGDRTMTVLLQDPDDKDTWSEEVVSESLACTDCHVSIGEMLPRNFSFNSPYGACPTCHGLGTQELPDEELAVVPDRAVSKAVPVFNAGPRRLMQYNKRILRCVADHYGFSIDDKFSSLPRKLQEIVLHGSGTETLTFKFRWGGRTITRENTFEGVFGMLSRRYVETESAYRRDKMSKVMRKRKCPVCEGVRLRPESLAVTVRDRSIADFISMSVRDAYDFVTDVELVGEEIVIATEIIKEIRARLGFLNDVGLGYLNLNRESGTLSGGEAQRIRLATQVGSGLTGVLYVLDEPSIGLHQRDNHRLLDTLTRLRDVGNTVIVVEHDPDTIRLADHVIDIGPGAGTHGGEIVAEGTPDEITACEASLTGQYLLGTRRIEIPTFRNVGNGKFITVKGAAMNNLKKINVEFPLGTFCCVTGVSGSGKSSLVNGIVAPAVHRHFKVGKDKPGPHKTITGLEHVDKMIVIDQSPIGRTPRSNPATYTGAFDHIRKLFSTLPEAKIRGYKPGRFSFNVKGGRCNECKGDGIKKIEMQFLPDVYVPCETCKGKRYNTETLNVRYKGRNISDVLHMSVEEATEFFDAIPKLKTIIGTLQDVGLGYVQLGQPATTLSGGEAQRVKLATELAKPQRGHTLYILDEPTTGLHMHDIAKLLDVLRDLRDHGNTILVIEHNLDVIKVADWIIDLGPEGGDDGGKVICVGTPEEVAKKRKSYTGHYLKNVLGEC